MPAFTSVQIAALQTAGLSTTEPPFFIVCTPEGGTPTPQFTASLIAAAKIPGINMTVKISYSSILAGDFSAITSVESYFPPNVLLQIIVTPLPVVTGSTRYRTLTMPLNARGGGVAPIAVPVIYDDGYCNSETGDWRLALNALKAWLVGSGRISRLFAMGHCPCTAVVGDAEFQVPSVAGKNGIRTDLSAYWIGGTAGDGTVQPGVGYTDALVQSALYNIAKGVSEEFPGIPWQFAYLNAPQQALGLGDDPTCALATAWATAMNQGAIDGGSYFVPIQQTFSAAANNAGFQLSLLAKFGTGQLYVQLQPQLTTSALINAGIAAALALNVSLIQIHGGTQPAAAIAFMKIFNEAPILMAAQGVLICGGGQGPLFSALPSGS